MRLIIQILLLVGFVFQPGQCLGSHSHDSELHASEFSISVDFAAESESICCDTTGLSFSCGSSCCITCEAASPISLFSFEPAHVVAATFYPCYQSVHIPIETNPPIA